MSEPFTRHPLRVTRRAFSLVEILVTVALLSVIVLGLMMMFDQTQRAFQGSMTQTDVLESGRAVMDLLARELEQMRPYESNDVDSANFYARYIPPTPAPANPLTMELPGSTEPRVNVLQEFFFLTHSNHYWHGIGYLVSTPDLGVGTLYRFETSAHALEAWRIQGFARNFTNAAANLYKTGIVPINFNRVADGIVHLRLRAYGTNGYLIAPFGATNLNVITKVINATNEWDELQGGIREISYRFYSNAVPAAVELELGILETKALERFRGRADVPAAAREFLKQQAGRVHLFRQRVPVRNVDSTVYR